MKKSHLVAFLVFFSAALFMFPTENAMKTKVNKMMMGSVINSSQTKSEVKVAASKTATSTKTALKDTKTTRISRTARTKKNVALSDTGEVEDGTITSSKVDRCGYDGEAPSTPKYSAQLVSIKKKYRFIEEEEFEVKIYMKNDGDMPWFSPDSKCVGARVYVDTARDIGRESIFYNTDIVKDDNSWVTASRIRMDKDQMRVDPGQVASFTFWSKADVAPSVYREYFVPVVDGVGPVTSAEFSIDIFTGTTSESAEELRTKLLYTYKSMRVGDMVVEGEKSVEVDLSDQKAYLKVDDYIVREFSISSGAKRTPTPTGTFKIMLKNDIRIGHESPHYIMPKFQMFTAMGAGFHALPSLGNDKGVFWTEAKEHIGTPVSHGCVRMLPEDAAFTYEFTDVGDSVEIHW